MPKGCQFVNWKCKIVHLVLAYLFPCFRFERHPSMTAIFPVSLTKHISFYIFVISRKLASGFTRGEKTNGF